jgi:hypothetical protein
MGEISKQHVKEVREPLSVKLGSLARHDCEYERNGMSNVFLFFLSS